LFDKIVRLVAIFGWLSCVWMPRFLCLPGRTLSNKSGSV